MAGDAPCRGDVTDPAGEAMTDDLVVERALRILVAEDEVPIAMELEADLRDAGFIPVGPAIDASEIMQFVESEAFDAAILDFGLLGTDPDTSLAPFVKRHIPMIVVSGYSDGWEPPQPGILIMKPAHMPDVVRLLRTMLDSRPKERPEDRTTPAAPGARVREAHRP